jgi:hypothetical protein
MVDQQALVRDRYTSKGWGEMGDTPPRWQHTYFCKYSGEGNFGRHADLLKALSEAYEEANKLGADGWEMVSMATHWLDPGTAATVGYRGPGRERYSWFVLCHMKRPY